MKIHLLHLFWREFRTRKRKMGLITFAICWGTLSILLMMSFGRGLSHTAETSFRGLGENFIIVNGGQTSKDYRGLPKGRRIRLYPEDVDLLKRQIPEIKLISPESDNQLTISYKGKDTNRSVSGVFSCFGTMRNQIAQAGGRFINPDDDYYSRRVAFLGWKVATGLFGTKDPIGATIYINRMPYSIIGLLKEKDQDSSYNGPDAEKVVVPFSTFALVDSQRYVDRIHIQPQNEEQSKLIVERVRQIFGRKYRFSTDDRYAIHVWNTIEDFKEGASIFKGIEIFLTIIGGLTLVIGAVGVTNLMYAIVKERTREIGVKMALGAKRRHIVLQFFLETMFIFVKGTAWGTLLAFNVVNLVRRIPTSHDEFGIQNYFLRPVFSLDILIMFVCIVGVLVFMSGLFPAMRASRLNPVEALRYE
jgi:putative ABC transport system permease protein